MSFRLPAEPPLLMAKSSTTMVAPTVAKEMHLMTTTMPTRAHPLEIRQGVLPECQAPVNAVSSNLQKSIAAMSQSLQMANISISNARVSLTVGLASATNSVALVQSSASVALASASTSASSAVSAASAAASAAQSSASISASSAILSVQSSASLAMASILSSVSASAALAMASISLDRNSAASQVAQANQQASDSKLAALNATQTAFAVLGTIVGSSLISILVYWLVSRRRKRIRNRRKRERAASKAMSVYSYERKASGSRRPSTSTSRPSQDYPEEAKETMPMAPSVHPSWDRQYPPPGNPERVSYFQPIEGVSPLPNFSGGPTARTSSLKKGPPFPVAQQNSTGNDVRTSEISWNSRDSRNSDVSQWSFIPTALGFQAALDEGRGEKLKEKQKKMRVRSNSLQNPAVVEAEADKEEKPILLQARSYVDLKSLVGGKKSKGKKAKGKAEEKGDEDDNGNVEGKKSSIGTAI